MGMGLNEEGNEGRYVSRLIPPENCSELDTSFDPINKINDFRIGLSPICAPNTRSLLSSHTDCLSRIASQSTDNQCQSALSSLGNTIQAMIQVSDTLKSYFLLLVS